MRRGREIEDNERKMRYLKRGICLYYARNMYQRKNVSVSQKVVSPISVLLLYQQQQQQQCNVTTKLTTNMLFFSFIRISMIERRS